jgi:hypothetical protein
VIGKPPKDLAAAVGQLKAWVKAGAHRRDLDKDGTYEHNAAVEKVTPGGRCSSPPSSSRDGAGADRPAGDDDREQPRRPHAHQSARTGFFDYGWWGYVSKDLRASTAEAAGRIQRIYCGKGSRKACRHALLASLREALKVTPQELYGRGACASDPSRAAMTATGRGSPRRSRPAPSRCRTGPPSSRS